GSAERSAGGLKAKKPIHPRAEDRDCATGRGRGAGARAVSEKRGHRADGLPMGGGARWRAGVRCGALADARGWESPTEEARRRSLARQRDAQRRGGAKVVTTRQRRQVVTHLLAAFTTSARRACRLVRLSRSRWQYRSRRGNDAPLRTRLRELAAA